MTDGWQYLVAWNNGPLDDPALITTVAAGGTAGGAAPTLGAHNVWTDVTQYVAHHNTVRGRQHELDRFETGVATIDIINTTGVFNSWNTSSPFTGLIVPMKLLQIRRTYSAVTYVRYTGHIISYPTQWPDEIQAGAQLICSDAFRALALADITSTLYKQTILADGATAYYRLGELKVGTSYPTMLDSSGNSRDGIYEGTVVNAVAGALVADTDLAVDWGAYAGRGTLPNAAGVTGSTVFSFDCWILPQAAGVSGLDRIYSQNSGAGVTTCELYINQGTTSSFIKIQLVVTAASGANSLSVLANTNSLPVDGFWHHVAFVRTGGLTGILYVDGAAVSATTATVGSAPNVASPSKVLFNDNAVSPSGAAPYMYTGKMDEFAVYNGVALSAAKILSHYQAGVGQWANQDSGTRISRVLDTIGWSSGARQIDTGDTTVAAVTASLASTKALTYMQLVELTEDGALYMSGDGKVRYWSRSNITKNTTVAATLGNSSALTGGTEIPFQPVPDLQFDDLDLWNEILVTRAGGFAQKAEDSTSQSAYVRRTQPLDGLLTTTDVESLYRAQYNLDRYSTPYSRIRGVVLRPLAQTSSTPTILGLDVLSRITVNRHNSPGGGTDFTQTAIIEKITEDVDAETGDWLLTFGVSPTDARTYWLLGDSVYGVLDTTTRLGY